MPNKVIGIVDLHGASKLGALNNTRGIASTSFLCRYAFIDFPLANFSNSGIDNKAVLAEEHLRSLIRHIGSAHSWTMNTKLGGLTLLYDEKHANADGYNHDINNLLENSWYLKATPGDVVVIAPSDIIYRQDFTPLIEDHVKNNHRISVLVQDIHNGKSSFIGEDIADVDDNGYLRDLNPNHGAEDNITVSLKTYIIDKEVLKGILHVGQKTSSFYSIRDTIKMLAHDMPIYTYDHDGYVRCFDSLKHYYEYSLELLDPRMLRELVVSDWPIYTKTFDTPPAKYGAKAEIHDCYIGNGSQIDGQVEHSIIGRNVIIKSGCVIRNSVILSGSYISEDTHIDHLVCDKEAHILHAKKIIGNDDDLQFIKRGDIV